MSWVNRIMIGLLIIGTLTVTLILIVAKKLSHVPKVPSGYVVPTTSSTIPAALANGEIVFTSNRSGNYEVWVMAADGSQPRQLTTDATTDAWWPRPSPDRKRILFNRTPAGVLDRDYSAVSLWSMDSDGTHQQLLRPPGLDGWGQQGHAEWSPDGTQLVMFGGSRINSQIFITDALGQHPQKLTDRGGTNIDPSFAPDGKQVVFIGCPQSFCQAEDYEVYSVAVANGKPAPGAKEARLTNDSIPDNDPYYSPDGKKLAWLSQVKPPAGLDPIGVWDVRIAAADGKNPKRLTGDSNITSRPIWSTDGASVLVHRIERGTDTAFQLFRIDVKSGKINRLTKGKSANEYPG
jgi:Tol biopolymer transport system component